MINVFILNCTASRQLSVRLCPEDQLIVTDRAATPIWVEATYTNATLIQYTQKSGGKAALPHTCIMTLFTFSSSFNHINFLIHREEVAMGIL